MPETLKEFDERFPKNGSRRTLVLEADGEVRAFGRVCRWPHDPPERRKYDLATDPAYRGRGYATALMDALRDEGTDLRADVRDDDPESMAFAESKGFKIVRHLFESRLDLATVDEAMLWSAIARAEAQGVRFFSFAETAMDEEAARRLWSVNSETNLDQPGNDEPPAEFEDWKEMVIGANWFDPAGQFLAAVGDEWVGLGAVGTFSPGRYYNLYTGVRRPHRSCGIATALKALGIRFAQARGGESLRTNNDSANAPMLAVNRKLGFQPLPGWYSVQRCVSQEDR